MFVVWLIGLVLAVLAPVVLALALWRLALGDDDVRPAAAATLRGGAIGAALGLVAAYAIAFIAERDATRLSDYWYAQVAAGFSAGAAIGFALWAMRSARDRAAELIREATEADGPERP
jgi:protein-S-isoprenylcysteine O-methyltransferase Ste14